MSLGASFDAPGVVSTLVLLMTITFVGTKVGYRWRDLGLLLIPVVGSYFWLMWMWRLASLPDRIGSVHRAERLNETVVVPDHR